MGHIQRFRSAAFVLFTTSSSRSSFAFYQKSSSSTLLRQTTRMFSSNAMRFTFGDLPTASETNSTMLVGKKNVLENIDIPKTLGLPIESETIQAMMESASPSGCCTTFCKAHCFQLGVLPDETSRNNHPLSVHTVTEFASKLPAGKSRVVFCACDIETSRAPLAAAVAKAFPIYSKKTTTTTTINGETKDRSIHVSFFNDAGESVNDDEDATNKASEAVCQGVQLAARLVDMPPEELTTTAYAKECRKIADELENVSYTEIIGEELNKRGYGGLYGVGKAAVCPPRLVILEYNPKESSPTETVALVGKGIVYDTGGLSLKPKEGMCGMKHDMGGSAGMLGGFYSAVKLQTNKRLVLLLCLAENAIGPIAFRNDDILTMYSGKTVEVNNCDAEGRLVLGDGVAHATKHIKNLDLVVDMATLTGAQLITTGKKHAGILANTVKLEQRAIAAGLHSGDFVFPMLYAPELLKKEFESKVADMKNSVKDRSNAQSSCAGHFIESHLDPDYKGGWLHVDMAGPASKDERGTGYGVGLLLSLLEAPGF